VTQRQYHCHQPEAFNMSGPSNESGRKQRRLIRWLAVANVTLLGTTSLGGGGFLTLPGWQRKTTQNFPAWKFYRRIIQSPLKHGLRNNGGLTWGRAPWSFGGQCYRGGWTWIQNNYIDLISPRPAEGGRAVDRKIIKGGYYSSLDDKGCN